MEEKEEKIFLIRDGSGHVFNRVKNPSVVYDAKDSVLLKIGEREEMDTYYEFVQKAYRDAGFSWAANDIYFMELPMDQEEIDKVFQICDYIGTVHRKIAAI